ncbi:hypothetical protein [Pseudoalteromonas nigrifaciens]|uniref:hypothetical protein n=1 Tax=Pseudoalteromonas nigrifaciens TaxID=28109 RepID=UPI003FD4F3D1
MIAPQNQQVFYSLELLNLTKSDTQTLVFGQIAYHHAKHGAFNSSMSAIAKYLKYSINAVKNAVKNLGGIVDDKGEPLIKIKEAQNSYNKNIKINPKHALGFKLLQSYCQIVSEFGNTKNVLNLYPVRLNEYKSKNKHDSRHLHKALMLKSLINKKIESNILNSKENKKTYQQTISKLMKKFKWSYVTVKNLLNTLRDQQAVTITTTCIKNASLYIFKKTTKPPKCQQAPLKCQTKTSGVKTPWLDIYKR